MIPCTICFLDCNWWVKTIDVSWVEDGITFTDECGFQISFESVMSKHSSGKDEKQVMSLEQECRCSVEGVTGIFPRSCVPSVLVERHVSLRRHTLLPQPNDSEFQFAVGSTNR